jgi:hypothetical protein
MIIYESGYVFETDKSEINVGNTPFQHNPQITNFEPIEILEGQEAFTKYWLIEFNKLDEQMQNIIKAVIPNVLERIKSESIKMPNKLYNVAINKLAHEENQFMCTCSRCLGTGQYSYNPRDGKMCLKCNGLKYVLPKKITNKWLNEVSEHFKEIVK